MLRTSHRENEIQESVQCFVPVRFPVGKPTNNADQSTMSTECITFTCCIHQEGYEKDRPSSVLFRQWTPQYRSDTVPSDKQRYCQCSDFIRETKLLCKLWDDCRRCRACKSSVENRYVRKKCYFVKGNHALRTSIPPNNVIYHFLSTDQF